jgi:hypothetical protein
VVVRDSGKPLALAGAGFATTFLVAHALLGELAGSVGEPDRVFETHFASESLRAADLAGSIFLLLSAIGFAIFSALLSSTAVEAQKPVPSVVLRASGTLAAVGLFMAAVSFATVPASLWWGELFDDSALSTGQAVLPQLGYAALVGAMVSAVVVMLAATRISSFPTWLVRGSYGLAVLLLVGSLMVGPMALLAVWVALVSLVAWREARLS